MGTHEILQVAGTTDFQSMGHEDLLKHLTEHERPFDVKFKVTKPKHDF